MQTTHKVQSILARSVVIIVSIVILTMIVNTQAMAQEKIQMMRMAKIKVDPLQLEKYKAVLKEQMAIAIRDEPGVLSYTAVADKNEPSSITILEIYADSAAYNLHIQTGHFKKYKETVKDMVKSLELVDLTLIAAVRKPGM